MTSPFPGMRDILAEARVARALLDPADLGMGLFNLPVNEFEQIILDWVQTPEAEGGKRRDARDQGKTDEEIAQLITYIMLAPQVGDLAILARARLTPHIEAYLAKRQGGRMDPKTVDMWLRAVLVAWREMFRTQYPVKVRELLRRKKGALFA